ncbi:hypothetical protein J4474_02705, partial [Candidatus Pacearchaeota archaeon]|nr:hypothetical protein [Candidatus Pacearchaeota archaeon]
LISRINFEQGYYPSQGKNHYLKGEIYEGKINYKNKEDILKEIYSSITRISRGEIDEIKQRIEKFCKNSDLILSAMNNQGIYSDGTIKGMQDFFMQSPSFIENFEIPIDPLLERRSKDLLAKVIDSEISEWKGCGIELTRSTLKLENREGHETFKKIFNEVF